MPINLLKKTWYTCLPMLVEIDFFVHKFLLILLGMNFLTNKSPILLLSMIDLQRKKFLRRCSLSSVTWMLFSRIPSWLEMKVSFTILVDNREWEMLTKFHEDRTINS